MDSELLESTVNQTQVLAAWVGDAETGAPIPTCPGWTLTDLVGHVGATQRWVSRLVGEGISDPGTAFSIGWESAPADPSAWGSWLSDGAHGVEATLAGAAIDDWLANMASSGWAANVPGFADAMRGDGQTIAWVTDDADQAWLLRRTEAPLVLTHDRGDADVTIHGPARELLHIVSRRLPLDAAETSTVTGDRDELTHLIENMTWVGAA